MGGQKKASKVQFVFISPYQLDWLQSFKQVFINVSYHILVASLTLMALFSEPSELDWLQVYEMTHDENLFKD